MDMIIKEFMLNPIAQSIGVIAYLFSAYSAYQKDEYRLRLFMALSALVWVLHHYLLHSYTASVLLLVIAVRCYLSSEILHKAFNVRVYAASFFVLLNAICTYYTWEGSVSLFAFFAATIATIAVLLVKGKWTRILLVSVEALWLGYNISVGSIGGVVACLTDGTILAFILYKDFLITEHSSKVAVGVTAS